MPFNIVSYVKTVIVFYNKFYDFFYLQHSLINNRAIIIYSKLCIFDDFNNIY